MAQPKFNRNFTLSIQTETGGTLTIQPPFTVEFDITRNVLTSANVCQIRIYNLATKNRNQLRFDFSNYGQLRVIELRAGYGTNLPIVFSGSVSQAWSVREGVNFVTTIECFDGGFAFINGVSNVVFPAGTEQESVYNTLIQDLPGVTPGAIGDSFKKDSKGVPFTTSRATTYSGNTADILNEISGRAFFVDNSKAYILSDSECRQGELAIINSESGLLGTPIREQTIVNFDMLFEPRIVTGQLIQLQSVTDANFNGFYKVISVKHRGMISESVCGDAITSVGFFYGSQALSLASGV